mgnify:CR=1 FL=1
MKRPSIFLLTILIGYFALADNRVKKVSIAIDELALVRTAIGIATIIQLPEPIQSVIVGDQGGFKIEYLDKAITIKPLCYGAKSNLYIGTQRRRYNVRLLTLNQEQSDFVVYLKSPEKIESPTVTWRPYRRTAKNIDFILESNRVGKTKDGYILLDFTLKGFENRKINPEWFYIYQGKDSKTINSLFLSSLDLTNEKPIQIIITLSGADLSRDIPARFEIREINVLPLELTSGALWR